MNWKTFFIQSLINENSFNDYLELGIGSGTHFRQIKCKNKTGVDITVSGNKIITCDTDQFFKDNNIHPAEFLRIVRYFEDNDRAIFQWVAQRRHTSSSLL